MAVFGDANTISKSYVSSVNFLDQREILNKLLDVTNEDYSFLDVMELMGQSVQTAVPEYHTFINAELYTTMTTASTAAVVVEGKTFDADASEGEAKKRFSLKMSAAITPEQARVGDLLMFPNGNVGYVAALNSSADTELYVISVSGADLYSTATDLNNKKITVFSNAQGEGSKSPASRRIKPVKQSNQVQIFKEKYRITDIQAASKIEFEFKGQPYYFLKGQHEALTRFRGDIAFALMFGDSSSDKFTDSSYGNLVDGEGNPVQTTKGLRHSIIDGGVTQSVGADGISLAELETLTTTLNVNRSPREYMIFTGTQGDVDFDNLLSGLTNTLAQGRFSLDGRNIDLGVDSFRLYGRTFNKKYLPMLDHKGVAFDANNLNNETYLVPKGKIKAAGSGESMDYLRVRYMATPGTDLRYKEIMLGGLAPTPTDERSVLECHYESVQGLEVLGVEHFAKLAHHA